MEFKTIQTLENFFKQVESRDELILFKIRVIPWIIKKNKSLVIQFVESKGLDVNELEKSLKNYILTVMHPKDKGKKKERTPLIF